MVSLKSGIPQSAANPLADWFDQSDEIAARQTAAMDRWRRESIDTLDRALLDPERFYADKPYPFPSAAAEALGGIDYLRGQTAIRDYLQIQRGSTPVPADPIAREVLRDRIARERFDGRGVGSDEAFLAEIRIEAQGRKDATLLMQDVSRSAATSALLSAAGEPAKEYAAWIAEARSRPGYRRDLEATYLTEWNERQRAAREQMEPVRELIARQWTAMKEGKTADMETLAGLMGDEAQRETLLYAIGGLVKALPKDQQPGILANLRKQFLRRDLPAQLGGMQRSMKPFDRDEPLPPEYLDQLRPGMDLEKFQRAKRREFERDARLRDRFVRQLESIVNDEYDPIVTHAKEGTGWAAFERGLYAAPGVALTVGVASLPGAGQFAMYEVLKQDSTDQARAALLSAGMDAEAADAAAADIGSVSGLIQLPMERLGLKALTGRLPFVNRAIDRLTANLATRYLARAAGSTAVEFTTEMAHDLVPSIVQDLAAAASQDMPDTQWTGEGGVFDGYGDQSLEVLGAIVPFSLLMAGGGVMRDRRIRAFAETPDLVKRAAGLSEDAIAAVNGAKGIAEQDRALSAAWETRDMESDAAKLAQAELTGQVQAEQDAAAAAADTGILPRAVRSAEGEWKLYDTATGTEIGKAPNWQGAARLATAHANFAADLDADRIATVFSTYQAAEASGEWSAKTGRTTETQLDLGREMTAADFAGESRSARERAAAQERLMGGDGSLTSQVFGRSQTEFADGQLRTVNRILGGGSVLDVFHEEAHGFRRAARAAGTLTREDDIAILRAVDSVLTGTTREGTRLSILPENFDTLSAADQDVAIDEGISQLMESEVIRTRKGLGTDRRAVPAGIVSKNLSALARLLGDQRLGKFRSFINAIREFFGLAIDRAAAIQRGLADGTLDRDSYDSYLAKLYGIDEQLAYEQMAREAEAEILDGAELVPAVDGDPFSLGRRPAPIEIPDAIVGHQLGAATSHPDYAAAKAGDLDAAARLAADLVTPDIVARVRAAIGDSKPLVLPVLAIEQSGRNKIPLAVAEALAAGLGLEFTTDIHQATKSNRGGAQGLDRVFIQSTFDGPVVEDSAYLIVDDTLTQGGTVAALADHLARHGATVAGIVALTGKDYSRTLTLSDETLQKVRSRLGDLEPDFREATGHGFDALTESEARTLATWKPLESVRSRILAERDETRRGNPPPAPGSFSLGAARLGVLTGDSIRRIQDPLRRAQAMGRISRKLEELRLDAERLELLAGGRRIKRSLAREARIRQAIRRDELENEAWARHTAVLSDDDLTKIKSQPGHAFLADPSNPLKGRLLSKTAAAKKHPDLFTGTSSPAEYDGSENVSRTLFGGTLAPDQAAQEMFEAGLIREPSTDAMWQLLESEAKHVDAMKRVLAAAKADLREARTVAKAETNAWLAEQTAGQQELDVTVTRQSILQRLAALDAILSSVPPEIRGKVGGYVQAARITGPDAGLEFLRERLAKVDEAMEGWLKRQYDIEFRALLDRARPERDEAGKRPRGKIGADVHQLFADLYDAMPLTAAETEAEALRLETLAAQEDLTPEQQSHATLQAHLVRLVGDWGKATAARREAAVLEATRVFEAGYMAHKIQLLRQREDRNHKRGILARATGKKGTREERRKREQRDTGTRTGRVFKAGLSLLSFEQIVQKTFGEGTAEANALVDWERRAAHAKADALQNKLDQLDDLFASLAGGKFKGEQLRHKLSDPAAAVAVDARGIEHSFSQLEAITATLMWRQEDGRRHMEGHLDDQGKPVGKWHFDQGFIDQLEDALSDNAKAVRLHLAEQYGSEYDRLNSVFRQLYGISMPRHAFYSPLTVAPAQAAGGQTLDPVTGSDMTGAGLTPGSLKTRSTSAIAEPLFRDALQTYIAHAKQMEHWLAYAPFATEAMALVNSRDVGNSVEAAAGKEALSTLRGWLDYFAQGGTRDAAAHLAGNQLLNRMMGRAAAVALVGRVSVLAIQATQLGAALAEMPAKAYIVRLAKLFAGRLDWSAAIRSDYIQRRKNQMPPVVQQAMEGLASSKPNRLKFAARKMGETISGADALFTAGTYAIAYDYHFAEAGKMGIADPHAYARQAAERSTDRVAQPTRAGTRSLFEVTGTNPAVRLAWAFASEPRQKLALAAYALTSKKPAGAKARALAVTWLAGGLMASVIRATMRDLRDDDDDEIFDEDNWDPKRLALASLTGPFQGIPFLGDLIESAVFKAFREYLPEGNMLSNVDRAIATAARRFEGDGPEDLEDAVKDAETILAGAGVFSESAAAAAGFSHLVRDLIGITENFAGD